MEEFNLSEKRVYECDFYKVVKRFEEGQTFAKDIWICKGCGKEFKQHTRFHNHNPRNCKLAGDKLI